MGIETDAHQMTQEYGEVLQQVENSDFSSLHITAWCLQDPVLKLWPTY